MSRRWQCSHAGFAAWLVWFWSSAAAAQPSPLSEPQPAASKASLELESKLASMLRSNGLTARAVASRAVSNSGHVAAKRRALEATEADLRQATSSILPSLDLAARYTRLSPIPASSLGGLGNGSLIVSAAATDAPRPALPNEPLLAIPASSLSFPVFLNQYVFSAGLNVPISDYLLKTSRAIGAAASARDGAALSERATKHAVARDGKVSYYQWLRAQGVAIVAAQTEEQAVTHLQDSNNALAAGMASRADVLRALGQRKQAELFRRRAETQVALAATAIAVAMGDPQGTRYDVGENVMAKPPRPRGVENELAAFAEAKAQRLELRALAASEQALRDSAKVARVAGYPRLDAQANAQYSNPNPRIFPQEDEFSATWDVGVVLSWTPTQLLAANAQSAGLSARASELSAQRKQLLDALALEVSNSRSAFLDAEFALSASEQSLAAAEEGYRVRRDAFRVGRATQIEVTDAETELLRARLELVNAYIDLHIARVEFEHALGRDAAS